MAESQDIGASSFDVCFLSVDGKPLTVIGPADAIRALERRLRDAPEVELHGLYPPRQEGQGAHADEPNGP